MSHSPEPESTNPEKRTPQPPGQPTLAPQQQAETVQFQASPDDNAERVESLRTDFVLGPIEAASMPTLQGEGEGESAAAANVEVPNDLFDHARYRITRVLGGGGMGMVYEAEHRLMDRLVALKVILPRFLANPSAVERFRREVKAAAQLHHPNIVTAFDADQAGQTHFLVMEFVPGQTLSAYLRQRGKLEMAEACDIIRQVALGLEHAHARKMVHRDIKPDNLMRTPDGEIKILDFGLARFAQEELPTQLAEPVVLAPGDSKLTVAGSIMGTPDYIAPEQVKDTRIADIRADIYALGCTLYQLLTGQVPFPEGQAHQKLQHHLSQQPKALRELRPDLPDGLVRIVDKMISKDPAKRQQTPEEVARDLGPYARVVDPVKRRRRRILASVAVALLLCFIGGFLLYWQQTNFGTVRLESEGAKATVAFFTSFDHAHEVERARVEGEEVTLRLRPGEYWLGLPDAPRGWRLVPDHIVIGRGQTIDVAIVRVSPDDPKDDKHEWKITPVPDAKDLATRPSPLDALAALTLPEHLPGPEPIKPIELVSILGGPEYRLSGPGSFAAFSADSNLMAIGSGADIVLFETATGKAARVFRGHNVGILNVALSADGKWLASAGADAKIRLWDMATGVEERSWPASFGVVAFSHDSRHLAIGSGVTFLWHDLAKNTTQTAKVSGPITHIGIQPKGDWVALAQNSGDVALFSRAKGELATFFVRHKGAGPMRVQVNFSPDGKLLAVGNNTDVAVWDVAGVRGLKAAPLWTRHDGGSGMLAFAPDGKSLYVGKHQSGALEAHNVVKLDAAGMATGSHTLAFGGEQACYALSPNGRWIGGVNLRLGRRAVVYDLEKKLVAHEGHTALVTGLAFLPDGSGLVSCGFDRTLRTWDFVKGGHFSRNLFAKPLHMTLSPDGTKVAVACADKSSRIYPLAKGAEKFLRHADDPLRLVYSPDGAIVFVAGVDGKVMSFDAATTKPREAYAATTTKLEGLTLDRTGTVLAAAGVQGNIHLWEVGTSRQLDLLLGHAPDAAPDPSVILALASSPDNRWLVSTGSDGTVRLWDWQSKELKRVLHGLSWEGKSLAISPDARWLAAGGSDNEVLLWDLRADPPTRLTLRSPQGYRENKENAVTALAFSPEGRYLAAGNADGAIHVYRLARVGNTVELPGKPSLLLERSFVISRPWRVSAFHVLPGGARGVSLENDSVAFWDLTTRAELARHEGSYRALTLAPDGRHAWAILVDKDKKTKNILCRWDLIDPKDPPLILDAASTRPLVGLSGLGQTLVREADGSYGLLLPKAEKSLPFIPPLIPKGPITATLSPDGHWAVLLAQLEGDPMVHLIDLTARQIVKEFPPPVPAPNFSFSSDGRRLAWIAKPDMISVYDTEAGRMLHSIHETDVRTLTFSPDLRRLLVGKKDEIALYDLGTAALVDAIRTPITAAAAFTPDSRLVYTFHLAGAARLWRSPP